MPQASNNGTVIEYDTIGNRADRPLLMVMGFTAQLTAWDETFCQMLADHGHLVIRFDNRDVGLSAKTGGTPPNVISLMAKVAQGGIVDESDAPYSLSEMAADGLAVLDDLGIEAANVVGVSMGGMIAQQMAIEHPERVLSLTSIMSTTGDSSVGQATPTALTALLTPSPADREGAIERGVAVAAAIAGPHFDEDEARARAASFYDRSFYPVGAAFQLAAIGRTGDRTERLAQLSVPTVVIHGDVDPLVQPSGGKATAAAIPDAKLVTFADMGHDLPRSLWAEITAEIDALTASSGGA